LASDEWFAAEFDFIQDNKLVQRLALVPGIRAE